MILAEVPKLPVEFRIFKSFLPVGYPPVSLKNASQLVQLFGQLKLRIYESFI